MNRGEVLLSIARAAIAEGFGAAPGSPPRVAWLDEKRGLN